MDRFLLKILAGLLVLGAPFSVRADMSSASLKIFSDVFSVSGGRSTSASILQEDTLSEAATGEDLTSTSLRACAGFQCTQQAPSITFTVSPNSVALGTLTTGSVASGATTITTTTNAPFGYVTTITEDGNLRTVSGNDVNDVSDGTVTAGSEEYGVGLTGSDRAFTDDRAITGSNQTVASNTAPVQSATTVTFKAAISTTTSAGSYSHIATFITTSTF